MKDTFSIDRRNPKALSRQVSDLVRRSVGIGRFRKGETLPSRAALARKLGVGESTVRAGLDALVSEGVLMSRRGVGYIVARPRPQIGNARVLIVQLAHLDAFAFSASNRILLNTLSEADYVASCVFLDAQSANDLGPVRRALWQRPDFVILSARIPEQSSLVQLVKKSGIPYLRRGDTGNCERCHRQAIDDFVAACCAAGVRSVMQVVFGPKSIVDAKERLERAGIWVENFDTGANRVVTLEEVQRASLEAMRRRLSSGAPLPDLLYFGDDYLTMGAMPALLEAGVRIPEDVAVVTLANRGFGPVFTKTFARIEHDSVACATAFAKGVVRWLRTGAFPQDAWLPDAYVPGETFPKVLRKKDLRKDP